MKIEIWLDPGDDSEHLKIESLTPLSKEEAERYVLFCNEHEFYSGLAYYKELE